MSATATPVRPLPPNTVLPVKGTLSRQEAVRRVVEGDELRIIHETLNPHDPNACLVTTLDGQALGYLPRDLAPRLSGAHPGGRWRAKVKEVLRGKETWGLRIWLGPLTVEGVTARAGADEPGLRHRGDGVAERDGVVVTAGAEPHPGPDPTAPPEDEVSVLAKSGRRLGTLIGREGTRVVVLTPAGTRTSYPAAVVTLAGA